VTKVDLTREELEVHLKDQLQFIQSSTESYDFGHVGEAKRLALTLRVLVHDTKHSKSLLKQLDVRDTVEWLSTATPPRPGSMIAHSGIVAIAHRADGKADYIAMLDKVASHRKLSFQEWWNEPVFTNQTESMSRSRLVLVAADQDGGGHVDPKLDAAYAHLKQEALGFTVEENGKRQLLRGAEAAAIRQIAHETLKTLVPGYEKEPDLTDVGMVTSDMSYGATGPGFEGWSVQFGNARTMPQKQGRNERCACGSGKKFKHCHGALR
jgi:hypothetical protein